jgi:DNA integrity scanning protein DisA with diadenylate cyclase activity
MSEETDAVLVVVSEESGRVSLAVGGQLEPVPRENLSRRLAALLSKP